MRSVRISDRTWDKAKAHAKTNGHTISDVIAKLLDRYNATEDRKASKAEEPTT